MDPRIGRALHIIEREYAKTNLQVGDLAKAVRLSPSRFHHLFQREVGIAPALYLRSTRIRAAVDLLQGSFLSVKEISFSVGMSRQSSFHRAYKRLRGATPAKERIQLDTIGIAENDNK